MNVAARKAFEDQLDKTVVALEDPQMPAALGVALIGRDEYATGEGRVSAGPPGG